jgi:hypothetical protein
VFFCFHLNHLSPVFAIALPTPDAAPLIDPACICAVDSPLLRRTELPCFLALLATCSRTCEGNCRFSAVNSRSRQIVDSQGNLRDRSHRKEDSWQKRERI